MTSHSEGDDKCTVYGTDRADNQKVLEKTRSNGGISGCSGSIGYLLGVGNSELPVWNGNLFQVQNQNSTMDSKYTGNYGQSSSLKNVYPNVHG